MAEMQVQRTENDAQNEQEEAMQEEQMGPDSIEVLQVNMCRAREVPVCLPSAGGSS